MRNQLAIAVILLLTLTITISVGMTAVLFPVILDSMGYNKVQIGMLLAVEILAIVVISSYISRLVSMLGLFTVLLIAALLRISVIYLIPGEQIFWVWLIMLFIYGMATNVFLINMQTWLGLLGLTRFSGLATGLYSAVLSAGIALGPWVLSYTGLEGAAPLRAALVVCISTLVLLICSMLLIPRNRSASRPRVWYSVRNAPVVMISAFVGGITFYGLPAFSTLFGLQNGLPAEQAAFLISAFMLGAIIVGFMISSLSDFFNVRTLIVICVFIGLISAVYLPLAIEHYGAALALLFIWGGTNAGIYGMGLKVINSSFRREDLVSANTAYGIMYCSGGVTGILLIGLAMELLESVGLSYVIVTAGILYFIFVLSRKTVYQIAR